jgi:xylan 1,4-beta-xylosidase
MQVKNNKDITFSYSMDGKFYKGLNKGPVDASFLPPWDRGVRVGLVAEGNPSQKAVFKNFSIKSSGSR